MPGQISSVVVNVSTGKAGLHIDGVTYYGEVFTVNPATARPWVEADLEKAEGVLITTTPQRDATAHGSLIVHRKK